MQGVGFRWFVRETARRLGLAGWVKNRADGTVEIAAEGDEGSLAQLSAAVREGPPGSRVTDVRTLDASGLRDLPRPFAVERG